MNFNVAMDRVVFFLLVLCSVPSSMASSSLTNTLKQGDALRMNSSNSTFLISANYNFTLGFFTPERTKRTYLAIRFSERDWDVSVWIANRETPLPTNDSAGLHIDAYGRLVLTYTQEQVQGKPYLLSSKQTSLNVTATLLDSGNFVLREVNADGSFGEELWSSFDYPTNTLFPGMKLGVNHRTGRNWTLTSWKDDRFPAAGAYSLEWEPSKRRLVIKYGGMVHWSTGELMNNAVGFQYRSFSRGFSGDTFKFVNISTKDEEYFSYLFGENRTAGWRLDSRGVLYDVIDNQFIIDVRNCYGYGYETQQSRGCEFWGCRRAGQRFEERSGTFMRDTEDGRLVIYEDPTPKNPGGSSGDCRENCWNDCDCFGYRDEGLEGWCGYWRGTDLQFEQDNIGNTERLYVLVDKRKSQSKKWIWILIPTATAMSTVLVVLLLLRWRRRNREEDRKEQELKELLTLEEYSDIHELNNTENTSLRAFSYTWIVATTNNFSLDCKLGHGGFGTVYKGITPERQEVAIKQLSETSKQGLVEFKNEVVLIAKLQHTNLVKLLGFCIHGDQKMLIYEFMPNKSLDFFLFDPNRKEYLTWGRRLNIIEGIAQGLLYLHKYSRVRIIHRDLKVSNILLDENMNPKIADFGMAKILRQNVTEANTMRRGGTYGYMSPEYAMEGIFSTKSDVYSFGVIVLEIVSGRKNNDFYNEDGPLNLVEYAWELWEKDAVLQLIDPAISILRGTEEKLCRCINVGLLCVEYFVADRPSMSDVITMLTNENMALRKPKKPGFVSRCSVADEIQEGKSEKFTVNELSISAMEARYKFNGKVCRGIQLDYIVCGYSSGCSESHTDTLKQGDALNSSSFLVSANNNFTLGFFHPKRSNNTYLAIQCRACNWSDPVWIGNRETPLPISSPATLQIDASGRLILTHTGEGQDNPYLMLSSKQTSLKVEATLLDSGNFVLREVNSDGEELWSSFDNPTDTLLPGMKLGVNHRTGRNWTLTSWQDDHNPAAGAFSLEWEPTKRRLVIKNRGVVRWTSGELMNATDFQHVSINGFAAHTFKYINISTKEEESFSYAVTPAPFLSPQDTIKNRLAGWRMDAGGFLGDIIGSRVIIDVRNCYGYENEAQQSIGCELWEQPPCRGGGQTFEERSGTVFKRDTENRIIMVDGEMTPKNSSGSPSDCRENCWNDCDCFGYRSYPDEGSCGYWRGTDLQFQQDRAGNTPHLYVINRPDKGKPRSKIWIWILIPMATSTVLLVMLLLRRRGRKREEVRKEQELKELLTLEEYSDIHELNNTENNNLKAFSYTWIVATTNNFSLDCKLGHGGFGTVYKGITPERQEVAIKQLSETSKQGLMEFKNEVVLIAKLQHTNLVKLLGFCIHGDQKMLIYEFMPNKSLDFFLFDPNRKEYLTWEKRLNIIEGIAQGLLYLHKYSRVRIIHRDLKVSNILLDENMNPKIADFGMAKILRQNVTEANTMRRGGTYGYMSPEYAMEGIFSTKSDVYSFGVIVLEIVSGRKNNDFYNEDGPLNLVEYAWELWEKDAVLQLIDPAISILHGIEEQLCRCINVGLLCVEYFVADRPSMSDVISMLTNENMALRKPKKPGFVSRCSVADEIQEGKSEKFTVNELSISAMEAR
ncbi:PREDICTED: uncharacterized protein LOC109152723 [Ipomoea nil]|uniref:uncharacterized protein LOC109152723 n=1 Tax=Ipomoea nil TaxID=35883 RepID=UPI000900BF7C|nr:PREDICTED: uncharacterized protein LOC109152723 [Ipomoea nil]